MEDHIDPKCIEIGARISSGSFGAVHAGRMHDPASGQWSEVAIKRMLPRARADPVEYTRFAKEVMFTAGLSKRCKHVLKVHGWSETDDGQLCLVMRKYDRGTLQELLDDCDRLPPSQVAAISIDLASGLAELHACNIIYNDMKPENCLVDSEGGIVLADFGVMKPINNQVSASTITQCGSPLFMSPEKLAMGTGARQVVTRAADIWALAISILHVATNDPTLPYSSGYTVEDMNTQLNIDKEAPEVPMLSELPGLQLLLQRCLALDPNARPSAAEVVEALKEIQVKDEVDQGKSDLDSDMHRREQSACQEQERAERERAEQIMLCDKRLAIELAWDELREYEHAFGHHPAAAGRRRSK